MIKLFLLSYFFSQPILIFDGILIKREWIIYIEQTFLICTNKGVLKNNQGLKKCKFCFLGAPEKIFGSYKSLALFHSYHQKYESILFRANLTRKKMFPNIVYSQNFEANLLNDSAHDKRTHIYTFMPRRSLNKLHFFVRRQDKCTRMRNKSMLKTKQNAWIIRN